MKLANYSLLTIKPNSARIDVLSVGVVALCEGNWHVKIIPNITKIKSVDRGFTHDRISSINANLTNILKDFESLENASSYLANSRSSIQLHNFIGEFVCTEETPLEKHLDEIFKESILPVSSGRSTPTRRNYIRRSLKEKFKSMGIMGRTKDDINNHKVVSDYEISEEFGLKAEFAIKNGIWRVTETVDFSVGQISTKSQEAQAKCLIMKSAVENLGKNTKGHIVVYGSDLYPETAKSIDLLSANGDLFMMESSSDMKNYYSTIEAAANL